MLDHADVDQLKMHILILVILFSARYILNPEFTWIQIYVCVCVCV